MATVYILDNHQHTGHASLELKNGEYISFHPANPSNFGPVYKSYQGEFSNSLSDDIEPPDYRMPAKYKITDQLNLSGLDEAAMSDAFGEMKINPRYNLFSMNCSTVVAKLLIVGAGEALVGGHLSQRTWVLMDHAKQFFGGRHEKLHGRFTEHALETAELAVKASLRVMEAEARTTTRFKRTPILNWVLGATAAADMVARELVWTPGEVLRYAKYIKSRLRELPTDQW